MEAGLSEMKLVTHRSYASVLWGLALAGLLVDQGTKYVVFWWLHDGKHYEGTYELVPGVFKFLAQFTDQQESSRGLLASLRTLSGDVLPRVNHGTLFSLGGEHANGLFAAVSIIAAIVITYWSRRQSTSSDAALCVALGLILAGTLGNLYDRMVFHGVRDFLYFHWIEWPVFNLADCCLVCGASLLLAHAVWNRPSAGIPEPSAAVA
jgi:lipoprotein signal peptidase